MCNWILLPLNPQSALFEQGKLHALPKSEYGYIAALCAACTRADSNPLCVVMYLEKGEIQSALNKPSN